VVVGNIARGIGALDVKKNYLVVIIHNYCNIAINKGTNVYLLTSSLFSGQKIDNSFEDMKAIPIPLEQDK